MKPLPIFLSVWGFAPCLLGEEPVTGPQPAGAEIFIPGPISDGSPSEPAPPPEVPDFSVIESRTRQLEVIEAPPMPGLPPVTGNMSVTVRKVLDPKLPALPAPLPDLPADDPAVQAQFQQLIEEHRGTELTFVSATIYDHSRTFLRIYPNGSAEGEVTAWSNIDFNHFSGFPTYRVTEPDGTSTDHGLLMGIGNTDTAQSNETPAGPEIPALPDLATGGPSFVVVDGADSGSAALKTLAQMHLLYAREGTRMRDAFIARTAAEARQRESFLTNPPKPKDLKLYYWRGNRPESKGGDQ